MRPVEQVTPRRRRPAPGGAAHFPSRPRLLPRYSHGERLTHWAVALAYVALFLSGLALFHPFFYWASALFGGGAFMRIIHPFLGVAFAVLFYAYALRLVRDNRLLPATASGSPGCSRT